METEYAWDVPEPFKMQPQKGTLEPRSSAWIQASFRPTAATVYDAQVVCSYGDNLRKTMRVEGVGKLVISIFCSGVSWCTRIVDGSGFTPGSIPQLTMGCCVLGKHAPYAYFPLDLRSLLVVVAQPAERLANRTLKRVVCVVLARQTQSACFMRMSERSF